MKSKIAISGAVLALLGLIAVQFYLISGLYRFQKQAFDTKYAGITRNALIEMQEKFGTNGFDSAFYMMDQAALETIYQVEFSLSDTGSTDIKQIVLERFSFILNEYETLNPYIKNFLQRLNLNTEYFSYFIIRELRIITPTQSYSIFSGDGTDQVDQENRFIERDGAIFVNSYVAEGNYFYIEFNYSIDFTYRTKIIYNEMKGAFLLSLLSIFVAGAVFLLTIRNMLKQKKLADLKSDFINNLTHELKTPLTTISVAGSSLANPKIQENRKKINDLSLVIKNQNRYLSYIIDHLLDINLWERDQITLNLREIDPEKFVNEKIEAFCYENTDKKFSITRDIKTNGKTIFIDEFQMNMVMQNLFNNALRYGGEEPDILVEIKYDPEFKLIISDNGIGIGKEDQKYIFDKFYRGSQGAESNRKGLGLGLFYVRRIIELHGGSVNVISKQGSGSAFIVSIPARKD